ncbi:hypothetical protein CHGG_05854 [Chaetomium globosum CBS 148.51]|uniref:SET domain-containing protein n=1 Tax=Chaetomium globosum (strain ATCC 6205 / CBS 148.51 / DSM 1962 / NBRC 6347 / NRRL 1970) TaxID=306901 RepID=Q2H661_CHAGB|nr:uncharacterized protein CHGG_05854 [Chaetomium globosum CBS 148.51]EAQ89235.1 hypothetical protein CHGG_05854 [Chaetomium globosum CBS 148.51]
MASPPGEAAQTEAPRHLLRPPPRALPAVRIRLISPTVGYGLFAARDLARDELVFHEAPLLTALFNEAFAADRALVASQVAACRAALAQHRHVMAVAFPGLAGRFGVRGVEWELPIGILGVVDGDGGGGGGGEGEGGEGMGMNLVVDGGAGGEGGRPQFAGAEVTQREYEAYTARLRMGGSVSEVDAREACLDFFKHYAFQVPPGGGSGSAAVGNGGEGGLGNGMTGAASTRQACVYLLGSLINHCCTPGPTFSSSVCASSSLGRDKNKNEPGPNCSWRIGPSGLAHFVKPRHICVQARRDIREGEQLTWDYGKREKGFVCECDTCREGGLSSICNML